MKKFLLALLVPCMALCLAFGIAACDSTETPANSNTTTQGTDNNGNNNNSGGGNQDDDSPKQDVEITGVTFTNASFVYDRTEHEITVTGTLPTGVSVSYTNNKRTNAGEQTATAVLSGTGYVTKTLTATLTVTKATIDLSDVTFENKTFPYDGEEHELLAEGLNTLPKDVTVTYQNNKRTGSGTSEATVTFSGDNYITATRTANLTVEKPSLTQTAKDVVARFFQARLDIWEFVPESLKPENMVSDNVPTDFNTNFVNVSSIGKKAIGKQLNVVYDIFNRIESLSEKVELVFEVQDTIVNLYQTFINDNPDNYASFTHNGDRFDFKIELTDDTNTLLVGLKAGVQAAVELSYEKDSEETSARIQLSDSNVLRYESSPTHLKAALDIVNLAMWQVEFDVNDDVVDGKLYEFYGTAAKNIKTVAEYHKTADYTYILGDKRESDDLKIEGTLEAYDNATGQLVGSKVKETVKLVDFDTQWFNLWEVTGINSIKKVDEENKLNADTIYINGSATPIKTKLIGGLSVDALSRRFDIEFKEVWYFQTGTDGKPEKVKTEIPMLFIQQDNIETFDDDFLDENKVTVHLNTKLGHTAVAAAYDQYVANYAADKQLVTREEITAFIGTKNSFFNS